MAALGLGAGQWGASDAKAEATGAATWYPNATTKHWHFYKGKMNPASAKSLKLFKCAETPIADEIAGYLGVSLNDMRGGLISHKGEEGEVLVALTTV